jgi:tRNA U34 2-thiouridine synthase MnmA/TrmU
MKKPKALVLFSGGLDSILVVKVLQEQGIAVEAVHFTCPFYSSSWARKSAKFLKIRLHEVKVDKAYFDMVAKPRHGYGSQMNPCIDCKTYMLRRAERVRKRLGLDFLATGEVVGERPLSQTRPALLKIENEAGLAGRVVRPLSGRILPGTVHESRGLIKRDGLLGISGRSRKPQLELAMKFGVSEYPTPAGGCLLTDPEYAKRLKRFLKEFGRIEWKQGELLRFGRHFWAGKSLIIVGRHEEDNMKITELAGKLRLTRIEVADHPGPTTIIMSDKAPATGVVKIAGMITARYSDAQSGSNSRVLVRMGRSKKTMEVREIKPDELDKLRP